MTDLEMTRLCAEAMGYPTEAMNIGEGRVAVIDGRAVKYDPLHDDAQAMALVKKLRLAFYWRSKLVTEPRWEVCDERGNFMSFNDDLNRAIVECAAQVRQDKAG